MWHCSNCVRLHLRGLLFLFCLRFLFFICSILLSAWVQARVLVDLLRAFKCACVLTNNEKWRKFKICENFKIHRNHQCKLVGINWYRFLHHEQCIRLKNDAENQKNNNFEQCLKKENRSSEKINVFVKEYCCRIFVYAESTASSFGEHKFDGLSAASSVCTLISLLKSFTISRDVRVSDSYTVFSIFLKCFFV